MNNIKKRNIGIALLALVKIASLIWPEVVTTEISLNIREVVDYLLFGGMMHSLAKTPQANNLGNKLRKSVKTNTLQK